MDNSVGWAEGAGDGLDGGEQRQKNWDNCNRIKNNLKKKKIKEPEKWQPIGPDAGKFFHHKKMIIMWCGRGVS